MFENFISLLSKVLWLQIRTEDHKQLCLYMLVSPSRNWQVIYIMILEQQKLIFQHEQNQFLLNENIFLAATCFHIHPNSFSYIVKNNSPSMKFISHMWIYFSDAWIYICYINFIFNCDKIKFSFRNIYSGYVMSLWNLISYIRKFIFSSMNLNSACLQVGKIISHASWNNNFISWQTKFMFMYWNMFFTPYK